MNIDPSFIAFCAAVTGLGLAVLDLMDVLRGNRLGGQYARASMVAFVVAFLVKP